MGRFRNALRDWQRASQESGRTVSTLVIEALTLRIGVGRIGLSEYIDQRLYLSDLSGDEKRAFGGWRAQAVLEEILIDDYSRFLSLDKVTMYSVLAGSGFPIPATRAVFLARRPSNFPNLDTPEALADFLGAEHALPIYLKPALGSYGRGNALLTKVSGDTLYLGNRQETDLLSYCRSLGSPHGLGWVLQEPLVPHSRIAELCGDKISGVRLHTFLTAAGSELGKAIFKINVGTEDSDNFRHGASGNLLAAIDVRTGIVTRVIAGTGLNQKVNCHHPVSGKEIVGFEIPYWDRVVELVCDAHLAFPGFICPGWDIAICNDGPRILEVNAFGDIDLSQHAYRCGFLDAQFIRWMSERGLASLLSGSRQSRSRSPTNQRLGTRRHHWPW